MPYKSHSPTGERSHYLSLTRTATYSYLSVLPLFLAYEVLILLFNERSNMPIRVGADVWIKQTMAAIGASGTFSVGILVLLIGTAVFLAERRKKIPLHGDYFLGMIAESLLYAVVVTVVVSYIIGFLFAPGMSLVAVGQSAVSQPSEAEMLVLSIGAGLYEELVFRVLLVGGLFWAFQQFTASKVTAYLAAAVLGALAFSAVHYMGALGDPFQLPSFFYRFLFGMALNGLFLVRGFGVAAWTHALYDVLVVSQILG